MVLGIAYAATIGGVGTLFGTAPNIILQSNAKNLAGDELSFGQYVVVGLPIVIVYLPAAWAVLMWMYPPRLPESDGSVARRFLLGQLDEIDPADPAQQSQRPIAHAAYPQRMTGRVVGHPVREIGADVRHAQYVD